MLALSKGVGRRERDFGDGVESLFVLFILFSLSVFALQLLQQMGATMNHRVAIRELVEDNGGHLLKFIPHRPILEHFLGEGEGSCEGFRRKQKVENLYMNLLPPRERQNSPTKFSFTKLTN